MLNLTFCLKKKPPKFMIKELDLVVLAVVSVLPSQIRTIRDREIAHVRAIA
jgi:hypothetical protein